MRRLVGLAFGAAMLMSGGAVLAQAQPGVPADERPPEISLPAEEPTLPVQPQDEGIGGTGMLDAGPAQQQASPDLQQPPLRNVEELPRETQSGQQPMQSGQGGRQPANAQQAQIERELWEGQNVDPNLPAQGPEQPSPAIQGRIVSIDPEQNTVTIRDNATRATLQLEVQDTSQVELAGKAVPLQSLSRGADVRASYFVLGDTLIAQELVAQPGSQARARKPAQRQEPAKEQAPSEEPQEQSPEP